MTINDIAVMGAHDHVAVTAVAADAATLHSAARQHLRAANALGAHDGVLLPQLMMAALSMSLFLMALGVHVGITPSGKTCFQPDSLLHALLSLPESVRSNLVAEFSARHGGELEQTLDKFSNAIATICHHHQTPDFYEGFDLHEFMQLARFFGGQELPS